MMLKDKMAAYIKDARLLKLANQSLYSIVWGQCTDRLRQRIEAMSGHEQIEDPPVDTNYVPAVHAPLITCT
jgi:hypothetical protein